MKNESLNSAVVSKSENQDRTGSDSNELKRSLGHRQMTMIGLGSALGTGLFLGSAAALEAAGPAVIISYIIGAGLAAVIAGVLGEMTSRHPVRGAFGELCSMFLSPYYGYLSRWFYWASGIIAVGGELSAAAIYLRYWWPELPIWAGIAITASLIIGVNLASVGSFGTVEFFLSTIKVIGLTVFIGIGILMIFFGMPGSPSVGISALVENGGFMPHGIESIWKVMALVIFSFVGIEIVSIAAAEAKDPKRAISTAMRTMIWRLAFFYVVSITIIVALTYTGHAAGEGIDASPFVLVFTEVGIPAAAAITNALILVAAVSAANANLYGATRLMNSLAIDGMAPAVLKRTTRRGVPVLAALASAAGILVAAGLAVWGVGNVFLLMISLAIFGVMVVWVLILLAYLAYRRQNRVSGELRKGEGFNLFGGSISAVIALVGVLAIAATAFVVPDMALAAKVGIPFLIVISLCYRFLVYPRQQQAAQHGSD